MKLKEIIESSPTLVVLGFLFTGFMSGVGAMEYLDGREKELRKELLAQVRTENSTLKSSNTELDATVKELVLKYINQQAILEDKVALGKNSEFIKALKNIDSDEISKLIRDPSKDISKQLAIKLNYKW
jgi:hypothetical protein